MSNDNHLEVALLVTVVHEAPERQCKALRVGGVKVGGGLVQGQDAAVEAERLGQGQADDEARQDLWTPSGHTYASVESSSSSLPSYHHHHHHHHQQQQQHIIYTVMVMHRR